MTSPLPILLLLTGAFLLGCDDLFMAPTDGSGEQLRWSRAGGTAFLIGFPPGRGEATLLTLAPIHSGLLTLHSDARRAIAAKTPCPIGDVVSLDIETPPSDSLTNTATITYSVPVLCS